MNPTTVNQEREAREAAYRLALWDYLSRKDATFKSVNLYGDQLRLRTACDVSIELGIASYDAQRPVRVHVGARSRERKWPLDGFTTRLRKAIAEADTDARIEAKNRAEADARRKERRRRFDAAVGTDLLTWATESDHTSESFDGDYCDDDGDAGITFVKLSYAQLRTILAAARKVLS